MILRRLTDAFRKQDWFTVLIETLIVVFGVFIGIQVANWNDQHFTAREAVDARARLISDLQNDRDVLAVRRKFYLESKDAAKRLEQTLQSEFPETTEAQWQLIRDTENAGLVWAFKPSAQVYDELLNSGKLRLVSNTEILRQMRDYYQDAALEAAMSFEIDNPYRNNSRRLISGPLIEYQSQACNIVVGADPSNVKVEEQLYFPPCPIPALETDILETSQRIHAEEELLGDIRLVLRHTEGILSFIEYLDDEAETLITKLEAD